MPLTDDEAERKEREPQPPKLDLGVADPNSLKEHAQEKQHVQKGVYHVHLVHYRPC
jgi:hypothetical protein